MKAPISENDWEKRDKDWELSYWSTRDHSHRDKIIEVLKTIKFDSILEVGCNCGANFYKIKQAFPNVKMAGVDINSDSIETGRRLVPEAEFKTGRAEKIPYPDKSFDVVLTDATLIYVPKENIGKAISEMKRVAKKALVMCEWHCERMSGLGDMVCSHWVRDYGELLGDDIDLVKINDFEDEGWLSFGNIIIKRYENTQ